MNVLYSRDGLEVIRLLPLGQSASRVGNLQINVAAGLDHEDGSARLVVNTPKPLTGCLICEDCGQGVDGVGLRIARFDATRFFAPGWMFGSLAGERARASETTVAVAPLASPVAPGGRTFALASH